MGAAPTYTWTGMLTRPRERLIRMADEGMGRMLRYSEIFVITWLFFFFLIVSLFAINATFAADGPFWQCRLKSLI